MRREPVLGKLVVCLDAAKGGWVFGTVPVKARAVGPAWSRAPRIERLSEPHETGSEMKHLGVWFHVKEVSVSKKENYLLLVPLSPLLLFFGAYDATLKYERRASISACYNRRWHINLRPALNVQNVEQCMHVNFEGSFYALELKKIPVWSLTYLGGGLRHFHAGLRPPNARAPRTHGAGTPSRSFPVRYKALYSPSVPDVSAPAHLRRWPPWP